MYYLNADFNYRQMIDYNELDIDCVHTVLNLTPEKPSKVTSSLKCKTLGVRP